jgi:hypothetical protein
MRLNIKPALVDGRLKHDFEGFQDLALLYELGVSESTLEDAVEKMRTACIDSSAPEIVLLGAAAYYVGCFTSGEVVLAIITDLDDPATPVA